MHRNTNGKGLFARHIFEKKKNNSHSIVYRRLLQFKARSIYLRRRLPNLKVLSRAIFVILSVKNTLDQEQKAHYQDL